MDENSTVKTGYHGTTSNYTESIEKHGLDPDKTHTRPDHWLGQGVYFLLGQSPVCHCGVFR